MSKIPEIKKIKAYVSREVSLDVLEKIYGFEIDGVERDGADVVIINHKKQQFFGRELRPGEKIFVEIKGTRKFFSGGSNGCDRFGIGSAQFEKYCELEQDGEKVLYMIVHIEDGGVDTENNRADSQGVYCQWVAKMAEVQLWDRKGREIPNDRASFHREKDYEYRNIPVKYFERIGQ